ncbi:MAG: hypothetical protein Q8S13_03730, partial [Dehalococcoidia bacterium]|nr:hypothetical protein [Dehalococcoidia bacterium]
MDTQITGGTPAGRTIIELSDAQMADVQALLNAGPSPSLADVRRVERSAQRRRGIAAKAAAYENYMAALGDQRTSVEPRTRAAWATANAEILRKKDIAPATVHQNATLSNMSVQYANEDYIGLDLMPLIQAIKQTDIYYIYGQSDRLQYPESEFGSRGEANEIQETRATATYSCVPHGYSNSVSAMTLANQDTPLDEMIDLTEAINEGLAFREEQRIATVLTTAANFGANTAPIALANRWNSVGGGNPIADIQDTMLANIWTGRGPGSLFFYSPLLTYNVLSRHPAILDLFKYGGASPGLATPDMIARFFMAERYLIGKARQDTANEAAAATYTRVWGEDSFGCVRVARRATI